MALGFDGHDQNMNYLLAGDPFGGESFIPHLNRAVPGRKASPLDAVSDGTLFANLSNTGSTVPLSADSAKRVVNRIGSASPLSAQDPFFAYALSRMKAAAMGGGSFAKGAGAMAGGYAQAPDFAAQLVGLKIGDPPPPPPAPPAMPGLMPPPPQAQLDPRFLDMSLQLFKLGVTRSAMFVPNGNYDAHDERTASLQPDTIGNAARILAEVFKGLASTPFDETRSFLDVTTVLACSEFGRTLRQPGKAIDKTGTDHNPLSNTLIIGGKGIRGGQVFGESDIRVAGEKLSPVHLAYDPASLKMMGKPFDFKTGKVRTDLPETYAARDYLGMASVANTIYTLFGVPQSMHRKLGRNEKEAPIVPGLLV